MEGFKSIRIENGDKPGTQKVTVVTDGAADLTKEDAVQSLGKKASRYVVVNWAKEGAMESEAAPEKEATEETKSDSASTGKETVYVAGMTGVT